MVYLFTLCLFLVVTSYIHWYKLKYYVDVCTVEHSDGTVMNGMGEGWASL